MARNNKQAFSLIELIFVIVVIGIISSIAIPKLTNIKTYASIAAVHQDLATIKEAIKSYYLINNKLNKISDSVDINPKLWSIDPNNDLRLKHVRDGVDCIIVDADIPNKELKITVDSTSPECTLITQSLNSTTVQLQ